MYVCICQAVTDRQIIQAAGNGAKNLSDLRRDLLIATECGLCAGSARVCLKAARNELAENSQTTACA